MIRILFFGRLSDVAQAQSRDLADGVSTVRDLAAILSQENLVLGEALARPGNRAAVNQVMVEFDAALKDGDEIAFMSPLSGG